MLPSALTAYAELPVLLPKSPRFTMPVECDQRNARPTKPVGCEGSGTAASPTMTCPSAEMAFPLLPPVLPGMLPRRVKDAWPSAAPCVQRDSAAIIRTPDFTRHLLSPRECTAQTARKRQKNSPRQGSDLSVNSGTNQNRPPRKQRVESERWWARFGSRRMARPSGRRGKRAQPFGAQVVRGLTALEQSLSKGQDITRRFTVRTVEVELEPRA
jgi:hypothetical protein